MNTVVKKVTVPILSLFVFTLSNGLVTTLISIRLHHNGASSMLVGAMMSIYYFGFICGSFRTEKFIIKVGHIRAFATFASFLTIFSLLQGLFFAEWFWLLLRFLSGIATAGIFVVIEAWLLVLSSTKTRGRILAFYMIALYAAQAMGQFLINIADITTMIPFVIAATLSAFAIIPLAMLKVIQPQIEEPSALSFIKLYQASGSGMIGCLASGIVLGAAYGLLPIFLTEQTHNTYYVSLLMSALIFGGMTLQYPVGKLSDIIERRLVLIFISFLLIIISLALLFNHLYNLALFTTFIFLFGGLTFTLYPLSITLACDNLNTKDIISGTQGLSLAYGVGATTGPLIAPFFIRIFGNSGLMIYFAIVGVVLVLFFLYRRSKKPAVGQEVTFIPIPQTTPITAELNSTEENKTT